jgi:hypothetical protein
MLSEFRTPLSPHTSTPSATSAGGTSTTSSGSGLRSTNIVNNLVKAIAERVTNGITNNEILSFDQQHHLDAIVSTALFLLPNTSSLHLLDCLANTPAGAYAILQTMPLIQSLISSMKVPSTSLHASTIIVKIASHEIDGTMKLLIDNGLIKQLLSSLKTTTTSTANSLDESYIQNAVYLLRVFADSMEGGISQLHLPKETIKILSDLILKFGHNEYLTSVAGSISSDLSNAFAIGPEAQLEAQMNLFVNYMSGAGGAGGWQKLLSDDANKTPYYYHAASGVSQWEEPAEYQAQLRVLDEIIELTLKLEQNLSDVGIGEECNDAIYTMLYNHCGDENVTNRLMKFVYAQVRPLCLSLPLTFVTRSPRVILQHWKP